MSTSSLRVALPNPYEDAVGRVLCRENLGPSWVGLGPSSGGRVMVGFATQLAAEPTPNVFWENVAGHATSPSTHLVGRQGIARCEGSCSYTRTLGIAYPFMPRIGGRAAKPTNPLDCYLARFTFSYGQVAHYTRE